MSIFGMSEAERKKISEQHKMLEKQAKEKKEEFKKGLQLPQKKQEKK
jgi:hypothetical protein